MNFKTNALNFIGFIIALIIVIALLRIAFWQFGIFKKEASLPSEVAETEAEVKYIEESLKPEKVNDIMNLMKNKLPPGKVLNIPEINPQEIGKNNIFE